LYRRSRLFPAQATDKGVTLTLAYLGEHYSAQDSASAFAAYITGNVASNLIGRLISAGIADHFGLAANFDFLCRPQPARRPACLFHRGEDPADAGHRIRHGVPLRRLDHASEEPAPARELRHGLLHPVRLHRHLSYVNFVLVQPPFSVDAMTLGIIYFVFLPSIATTPLAGRAVKSFGTRATFWGALAVAALGLPLMLSSSLAAFLTGTVLVGVGTFFAQATATGFVGRAASSDRGSASGLYLAFYFFGGLMGAAILGQLFDRFGWEACVAGIGVSLLIAALLAVLLKTPMTPEAMLHDA
jgi:YNFM family putative membrane transporter